MRRGLRCRTFREEAGDRIEVSGALTQRSQQRVLDALWRRARGRDAHITVDLTGVTYFEGPSVITLIGTKRIVERQRGCTVDLCGLDTATDRILASVG